MVSESILNVILVDFCCQGLDSDGFDSDRFLVQLSLGFESIPIIQIDFFLF